MSAWDQDLGALCVRSIALPRDGGIHNKGRRFDCATTDLHKTFAAERRRLKATTQQALPLAAPEPTTAAAGAPAVEPSAAPAPLAMRLLRPLRSQAGRASPDAIVLLGSLVGWALFAVIALTHRLPGVTA